MNTQMVKSAAVKMLAAGAMLATSAPALVASASVEEFNRDYVRVNYIQNENGNDYLGSCISTGIMPGGHVPQVDITYRLVTTNITASTYVFGYWDDTVAKGTAIGYETGPARGRYRVYGTAEYYGAPDGAKHTASLNGPDGTKIDGVAVMPNIKDVQDDGSYEYLVFARNEHYSNGTTRKVVRGVFQVFALTIRQDGTLVRDFIPCVRRSDGAPGLYDQVEGNFYGNSGTGQLLAGPVIVDESQIRRLSYVESTGLQYVDIGIVPNNRTPVVRIDYQMTALTDNKYVFGYYAANVNPNQGTAVGLYGNQIRYRVGTTAEFYGTADTNRHSVVLNSAAGTYIDGVKASDTIKGLRDPQANLHYYLFGRQVDYNPFVEKCCARIYSFAIDIDGETVLDLVPAKLRPIGPAGLWDRRTGRFFFPLGDSLIEGPIKSGFTIILI